MTITWKPCPLCGNTSCVEPLDRKIYSACVRQYGDSLVKVECRTCHLELTDYRAGPHQGYTRRMAQLAKRWNALPR